MHLTDLDLLTKKYADAHTQLSDLVGALNDTIERLKRDAAPALKKAVALAVERKANLTQAIDGNRALFEKPRTHLLHGIKVGLQKQRGGLAWGDDAKVVERIERLFKDNAPNYLHIKKTPDRQTLNGLPVCQLRQLGIELLADQDAVLIKPTASDIDKLVDALLKDAAQDAA